MIVVVGHGPSILSGLGAVIDQLTVIRLKEGLRPDPKHWGTRTDYLCARSSAFQHGSVPFWHFSDTGWTAKWLDYFYSFEPRIAFKPIRPKPSTGLCAVFCAMEYLKPKELAFIGFDRLLDPDRETYKWHALRSSPWPHDAHAEHRALYGLGLSIIDLVKHGAVV